MEKIELFADANILSDSQDNFEQAVGECIESVCAEHCDQDNNNSVVDIARYGWDLDKFFISTEFAENIVSQFIPNEDNPYELSGLAEILRAELDAFRADRFEKKCAKTKSLIKNIHSSRLLDQNKLNLPAELASHS